jgi:hypothetical protein
MTAFISITENEQRDFRIAAHRETSRLTYGEPLGFILWSDDSPKNSYANAMLDTQTKEVAWQHVDIFGNCGGCGNPGGSHKTILGKEFDNVCITTFRFDNPNAEEIECIKKLIQIRIKDIVETQKKF